MTCRDLVRGMASMLAELDDDSYWTMAKATGRPGPHLMQQDGTSTARPS